MMPRYEHILRFRPHATASPPCTMAWLQLHKTLYCQVGFDSANNVMRLFSNLLDRNDVGHMDDRRLYIDVNSEVSQEYFRIGGCDHGLDRFIDFHVPETSKNAYPEITLRMRSSADGGHRWSTTEAHTYAKSFASLLDGLIKIDNCVNYDICLIQS